jgi:hypothetical protein
MRTRVWVSWSVIAVIGVSACGGGSQRQAIDHVAATTKKTASSTVNKDYARDALIVVHYCTKEVSTRPPSGALRSRAYDAAGRIWKRTRQAPSLVLWDGRTVAQHTAELRFFSTTCDDALSERLTVPAT